MCGGEREWHTGIIAINNMTLYSNELLEQSVD
jgi:hypothetical protein